MKQPGLATLMYMQVYYERYLSNADINPASSQLTDGDWVKDFWMFHRDASELGQMWSMGVFRTSIRVS
jgi:hypothetical protein